MRKEDLVKAFDVAKRENNISWHLKDMLKTTLNQKYNKLVLEDCSFIYTNENKPKLEDFAKQLHDAKVTEFILIDQSTALMKVLHSFNSVGLQLEGVTVVQKEEFSWTEGKDVIVDVQGLLIRVEMK